MDGFALVSSLILVGTLVAVTIEWLRRRGPQRRDAVLALLPLNLLLGASALAPEPSGAFADVLLASFFLAPLLFLRLVRHLHDVPGLVYGFALVVQAGLVAATLLGLWPAGTAIAGWLAGALAPYVLISMLLVQSALGHRGVGRRRRQWAALAGLLTALVWAVQMPAGRTNPGTSTEATMAVAALCFTFVWAFATPRVVRQAWRAIEFQNFVAGIHAGSDAGIDARLERMRQAVGAIVEADGAYLLTEGDDGGLYISEDPPFPGDDGLAWRLLEAGRDEPYIQDGWTIIGLQAPDQPRRVLAIRLAPHRLFPGEDEETMRSVAMEIRSRFMELVFRQMESAAREAAEELATFRSEYLRAVAHEIANPLTPIKMQLAILRRKHGEESAVPFQRIQKSLERVEALIRDVSTISRLGSAGIQLETEALDLSQMVQDAVDAYTEVAKDGGCRIEAHIAPGLGLLGDGLRVRQIIDNLCSNAIKYSPDGGTVTVTARVRAGLAEIIVADQGLGMSREQMDRLFSSYGRVHTDVAPQIPGTGMGLYIARQLARLHGGDLEVFSDGPGQGTRFKLSLPTAGPPETTVAPDQPPIPGVRIRS